jgi:endonuclease YncB( thermonuclease family)
VSRRLARRAPRLSSRRSAGWLFVLVLIAIVSLVAGLPYYLAGEDAQRPPIDAQRVTLTLPPGVSLDSLEEGRVEEVIDGDTIDVILDGREVRVRYFGVDTPERGRRCFREATDRNELLIGERVLLLRDQRETDSFGRLLRYVFLPSGVSVDATLVAEGFGLAWREDGRYRDQIIGLETQADAADRGCLWGE